MKRRALALLVGAASVASCTIYALSDDIHQDQCQWELGTISFDDSCEALNNRSDPDFDRCRHWRCGDDHYCEIGLEDQDRDGFASGSCVGGGKPGDCDDRDPESHPGATEVCDGKDNDCDDAVDESMLQIQERVAMTFDSALAALAFAWNDVTGDVGIAYRKASDDAVGFGLVTVSQTGSVSGQDVWPSDGDGVFHASGIGVAAAGSGTFMLSLNEAAPTHRLYVGNVSIVGTARAIVTIGELNHERTGLRCAADEACAATQGPPLEMGAEAPAGPAPMIPESTAPQIAVLNGGVLAGYARGLSPAADGCSVTAPQPPLLLNLLEPQVDGYSERTANAIRLGESSELRSPRIIDVQSGLIVSGPSMMFGYLASFVDAEGAIVVRQVLPKPTDALTDLQVKLTPDAERYHEVQLVRGTTEGDRMLIGVAALAGCDANARVVFGVLQLTWDVEGRPSLSVYRELHEVGAPGQEAHKPVLAYNRSSLQWAVAYASSDGVFTRVLDRNGQPVGEQPYQMTAALPSVLDMTVVAGSGQDRARQFTVYTYEERANDNPSHVLVARQLRACADSTLSRPVAPPPPPAAASAPMRDDRP